MAPKKGQSPLGGDAPGRCSAKKKDGTPCRATASQETGFCLSHDPSRQDILAAARTTGAREANRTLGRTKGDVEALEPLKPAKSILDLIDTVAHVVKHAYLGNIAPNRAQVIGQLAKIQLELISERDKDVKAISTDEAKSMSEEDIKRQIRKLKAVK